MTLLNFEFKNRVKSIFRSQLRNKQRESASTIKSFRNSLKLASRSSAEFANTKASLDLVPTAVQDFNSSRIGNALDEKSSDSELPAPETKSVASKTPLWDQAVSAFRENCPDEYSKLKFPVKKLEYDQLGLSVEFENSILNKKLPEAFQDDTSHVNHAIIRRLKNWLPALGSAKSLAMTVAKLDPHQLAPYIVAGSFFAVEVSSITSTSL